MMSKENQEKYEAARRIRNEAAAHMVILQGDREVEEGPVSAVCAEIMIQLSDVVETQNEIMDGLTTIGRPRSTQRYYQLAFEFLFDVAFGPDEVPF